MAIKLHSSSFVFSSSSNPCISHRPIRVHFFCNKVVDLNHFLHEWGYPRNRCRMSCNVMVYAKYNHNHRCKVGRGWRLPPSASADDGVIVNGTPQTSSNSDMEGLRAKLNQSLQNEDYSDGLVQSLHDAARVFELAISSLSKFYWFSTTWLGVDRNAWVKALSYQTNEDSN